MRFKIWLGLVFVVSGLAAYNVRAQTTPPASDTTPAAEVTAAPTAAASAKPLSYKTGLFAQGGFLVGSELQYFKTPGFGITGALGYQVHPRLGLYLRSDIFAVSKDSILYIDVTALPSARVTLLNNLYGFAGLGYNYLHAGQDSTITGTRALEAREFHSVTAEGGAGYTHFLNEKFGIGGEAGLNFTHLEKGFLVNRSLWRPFLRVNASWQF